MYVLCAIKYLSLLFYCFLTKQSIINFGTVLAESNDERRKQKGRKGILERQKSQGDRNYKEIAVIERQITDRN